MLEDQVGPGAGLHCCVGCLWTSLGSEQLEFHRPIYYGDQGDLTKVVTVGFCSIPSIPAASSCLLSQTADTLWSPAEILVCGTLS